MSDDYLCEYVHCSNLAVGAYALADYDVIFFCRDHGPKAGATQ